MMLTTSLGSLSSVRSTVAWLWALALLAGAARCPGQDWPLYRGDAALRGRADGTLPKAPRLVWSAPLGRNLKSAPVAAGGLVVAGSDDGTLRCLNLKDGTPAWQATTDGVVEGPPLIAGQTVYAGTTHGVLHALSLADGAPRWTFKAEDKIVGAANLLGTPGSPDARILVGSYDMKLYCLNGDTGEMLWSFATDNYVNATAAVANGQVLFGGCDGLLHILDAAQGLEVRAVDVGSYVAAPVSADAGFAFLGHYGGEALGIEVGQGSIAWRVSPAGVGAALVGPLAVGAEAVVLGARDGFVRALDRRTGAERWSFRTGGPVECGAVICGGQVAVGSDDGRLYVLDLPSGEKAWSYEIGAALTTPLALAGGLIVVGAADGRLYAVGDPTGPAPTTRP